MLVGAGTAAAAAGDLDNTFAGDGVRVDNLATAGNVDDWLNDAELMSNGSIFGAGRQADIGACGGSTVEGLTIVYPSDGASTSANVNQCGFPFNAAARAPDS